MHVYCNFLLLTSKKNCSDPHFFGLATPLGRARCVDTRPCLSRLIIESPSLPGDMNSVSKRSLQARDIIDTNGLPSNDFSRGVNAEVPSRIST